MLLANCIPSTLVIKNLLDSLLKNLDSSLKAQLISVAAEFQHRLVLGNKEIFHLEAFAAKCMSVYSKFLIDIGQ